jgi:hypothetical protein
LEVINGLKGDCRGRFENILKEIGDRAIERGDTASSLLGGRYVWWNQPPNGLDIPVILLKFEQWGCDLKKKLESSTGAPAPLSLDY